MSSVRDIDIPPSLIPYKRRSFPYSTYDFYLVPSFSFLWPSSSSFSLNFHGEPTWHLPISCIVWTLARYLWLFSGGRSGVSCQRFDHLVTSSWEGWNLSENLQCWASYFLKCLLKKLLQKNGCNIQMPTPNVVNKMLAFEMIFRANNILPDFFVFKFFFRFSATDDKFTFSARRGGHFVVPNGKTPKNSQEKWLWINRERVGQGHYRVNNISDVIPKLFPHNQAITNFLKMIQVIPEGRCQSSEVLLSVLEWVMPGVHEGRCQSSIPLLTVSAFNLALFSSLLCFTYLLTSKYFYCFGRCRVSNVNGQCSTSTISGEVWASRR